MSATLSENSTNKQSLRAQRSHLPFSTVTEHPGGRATPEQLSMLFTRYHFASEFCRGKDLLEAACGAGLGLGYLKRFAKTVRGVDIDEQNLNFAKRHYQNRKNVTIHSMDAQDLSFADSSFDVIILFEAIYYLPQPPLFLAECFRVLRENGTLLINTVNPQWQDFNPSPFSTRYFSARELSEALEKSGFHAELYGAFPAGADSLKSKTVSFLKRMARNFGLIPKTLQGREFLKGIFLGKLSSLPQEVDETTGSYQAPVRIPATAPVPGYKVLYVAAQKNKRIP